MTKFGTLLDMPAPKEKLVQITPVRKAPKQSKKMLERGCEFCPSNQKKGINKVKGKVRGKKVFIVGLAPGYEENREQKEFMGRSGKFLWKHLAKVGISRKDCDIQNVVRCFPADKDEDGYLQMRNPSKEELHCCSLYTDKAVAKSRAKVYLIFGDMAAQQFLGKDEYRKTRKIFYSEKLQAKVYCLYHPSYFVRGVAPAAALKAFKDGIAAAANDLNEKGKSSRFAYLEKQNYKAITKVSDAIEARRIIRESGYAGRRVAADIEDDDINGKRTDLCIGFSHKPGNAFVFITGHPLARKVKGGWLPLRKKVQRMIRRVAISILEDEKIKKAFHKGSYDTPQLKRLLNATVRGWDFDTMYAEYLSNPDARAYGLNAIAIARYPQFGEYKTIIVPEVLPKDVDLSAYKIGPTDYTKMLELTKRVGVRFSQLSLHRLVLYNGADCDLTKRIEVSTKKRVNLTLLNIYKDASFILDKMEPNGPAFDFEHCEKLKKYYPTLLEKTLDKLHQIAGPYFKSKEVRDKEKKRKVLWDNRNPKTEFNPGSPIQIRQLLFEKLRVPYPLERKFDRKTKKLAAMSTGKKVMERLARKHEVAELVMRYRQLAKIEGTYLESYEQCARENKGLLRTRWNLTGTRTGRLSSGGGKKDEEGNVKVINLQNVHGDPNLKNQVVADPKWRKLYEAIKVALKKSGASKYLDQITAIQQRLAKITGTSEAAKKKKKEIEKELYGDKETNKVGVIAQLVSFLNKNKRYRKLTKKILAGALGSVMVLLGFDQGQVEVRVMAQASGDKNLIRDCKSGDIHSKVGHAMTGWPIEKIKKDKKTRTLTKNIHFGILFGLGANGLYEFIKAKDPDTDLTEERALELYHNYFKAYPGVQKFVDKMRRFVEKHGYVENMFGFRRPLDIHGSKHASEMDSDEEEFTSDGGAYWGNQAINTPIQGAAHIIMLMAMAIMKRKPSRYKQLVPTLEVHDYMGFKVKIKEIFDAFDLVRKLLEVEPLKLIKREYPQIKWKIPLMVEGNVGFRLGDAIEAENKTMPQLLAEMFIETFCKEVKLEADIAVV